MILLQARGSYSFAGVATAKGILNFSKPECHTECHTGRMPYRQNAIHRENAIQNAIHLLKECHTYGILTVWHSVWHSGLGMNLTQANVLQAKLLRAQEDHIGSKNADQESLQLTWLSQTCLFSCYLS